MGYLGINNYLREKPDLKPISEEEFIRAFSKHDSQLKWIYSSIREIDPEHNGYVTRTELDDILKAHMPKEFGDKDLVPIIRKFCSISNKILIDYKRLQAWLGKELARLEKRGVQATLKKTLRSNEGLIKTPVRELSTSSILQQK